MGLRGHSYLSDYNCFFVTTTCYKKLNLLNISNHFNILYDSILFVSKKFKSDIVAYVFMHNHIHLVVFFHEKMSLSEYMRDLKKYTAFMIRRSLTSLKEDEILKAIRYEDRTQKFKIWQSRFDNVPIEKTKDIENIINYIHQNPVKRGLVSVAEDYTHSSSRYYELNEPDKSLPLLHYQEIF
ncbi:MAG: transposase [Bacteroidetes bacterium]|nr:transposase [Bacteroidota bacterium]